MKAFGSRRKHEEWKYTRMIKKKIIASKPLKLKSRKTGRKVNEPFDFW